MIHVQCKTCGKWEIVNNGQDGHEAVDRAGCICCPQTGKSGHHHGQAAGTAAEGGVPCRPLHWMMMAGVAPVGMVA